MNEYLIRLSYCGPIIKISAVDDAEALRIVGNLAVGPIIDFDNIHVDGIEPFMARMQGEFYIENDTGYDP